MPRILRPALLLLFLAVVGTATATPAVARQWPGDAVPLPRYAGAVEPVVAAEAVGWSGLLVALGVGVVVGTIASSVRSCLALPAGSARGARRSSGAGDELVVSTD